MSIKPDVYVGVWTNWSRGPVLGSTLTLNRRDGNLLIAFVAFFIAMVGTRFWRIGCLIFHYSYSSAELRDGIHHQRQAMLRNTANPESGMVEVLQLVKAWRQHAGIGQLAKRFAILLVFSVITVFGFAAASGFSAIISINVGSEVLLSANNCHVIDKDQVEAASGNELSRTYFPYVVSQISNAANYARQCYNTTVESSRSLGCDTFPVLRLPTIIQTNASCPFNESICKSKDQNLILDTGYIDSHKHLGINTPESDRFLWRRVLHCGPIVTDGYTSEFNGSIDRSFTRYHYGSSSGGLLNFTYGFTNDAIAEARMIQPFSASADYTVGVRAGIYKDGKLMHGYSTFNPIQELYAPDADTYLFFLSAGRIGFTSQTTDPWYRATEIFAQTGYPDSKDDEDITDDYDTYLYKQDEPASPLICKAQFQWCSSGQPAGPQCGPLGSAADARRKGALVFPDPEKALDRLSWISLAGWATIPFIADVVDALGSYSLNARYTLAFSLQGSLPDNQWMRDVEFWNDISLASVQSEIITAVTGPADQAIQKYYSISPETPEEAAICQNQKILSAEYVSFSVFGLSFITVVGGLIILISYSLDPVLACLRKRYGYKQYQQLEWRTNGTLQLQRLVYEEIGVGTWSKTVEVVPVTEKGETLVALDLSDTEHPKMMRQSDEKFQIQQKQRVEEHFDELPSQDDTSTEVGPPYALDLEETMMSSASVGSTDASYRPQSVTEATTERLENESQRVADFRRGALIADNGIDHSSEASALPRE